MNKDETSQIFSGILSIILVFLVVVFVLTGCSTAVPVVMKFPDAPADMFKTCPDLQTIDPNTTQPSVLLNAVTENYQKYHDCRSTVNDWIDWHREQKKIYDSVK